MDIATVHEDVEVGDLRNEDGDEITELLLLTLDATNDTDNTEEFRDPLLLLFPNTFIPLWEIPPPASPLLQLFVSVADDSFVDTLGFLSLFVSL